MTESKIYVLTPDHDKAAGGVKILYRHVDVLRRNGFDAVALHQKPGFRCTWFENETPVEYLQNVRLRPSDYLVIPEIFGPNAFALGNHPHIGRKCRKVIFNQNCYYTFLGYPVENAGSPSLRTPYAQNDEFVAAIVVSDDSRDYLRFAFPHLDVYRIHNAIDTGLFSRRKNKKRQICFMPRKHPEEAVQVLNLLRIRGALDGFRILPIDKMNERQVARALGESLIFLSFGYPEGCPLPPAEAMACGCIVVGYHGMGGREYFKPEFSYPVDIWDITGFVRTVEEVIGKYRDDPSEIERQAHAAARYIQSTYSSEVEENDICSAWNNIMSNSA